MVWNKKYRSKVHCVQMNNLRGVLGVRRIDKMRNERIRKLSGVKKGVNERINASMLRWFGHVERMSDSRLVKRMYSGECAGNRPAWRPKKKWIESVKECLEERNVSLAEAIRKVHNRSEWRGFVRGVVVTHLGQGMNPTLTRCHSEVQSRSREALWWIF